MRVTRFIAVICAALLFVATAAAPARAGNSHDGRGAAFLFGIGMVLALAAVQQGAAQAHAVPTYPQTGYAASYAQVQPYAAPYHAPVVAQPTYQPTYQMPYYQAEPVQALAPVARSPMNCRPIGFAKDGSTLYACR